MTVVILFVLVAGFFAVWERVDAVRQALDDVTYLLEELARPESDAPGTARRGRRRASRL